MAKLIGKFNLGGTSGSNSREKIEISSLPARLAPVIETVGKPKLRPNTPIVSTTEVPFEISSLPARLAPVIETVGKPKLRPVTSNTPVISTVSAVSAVRDPMAEALQNTKHTNWRDAYAEYSGKKGSLRERRDFRRLWKDEANVRARVGEDTYNQLRATAEQLQFGSLGYNPDGDNTLTREEKRFDRRFNRRLRNGKYDSYLTKSQPTSSTSPTNDYNFQGPLLFDMTAPVFRTAYSFGSYTPPTDSKPEQPEQPKPEQPEQPIDYNKAGVELLGSDYMKSDNLAKIQQFLVGEKYDLGTYGSEGNGVDGKYGQKTHDALTKYFDTVGKRDGWKNIHNLFNAGAADVLDDETGAGVDAGAKTETGVKTETGTEIVAGADGVNTQNLFNFDNFVNEQNLPGNNIISKNGHRYVRFDPRGSGDFYVGDDGNIYSAGMFGILGNITNGNEMMNIDGTDTYVHGKKYRDNYNYLYNLINPVPKQKQGGKMNRIKYFQQGGQMQQQDPKQQITQLVQAAMLGDEQATQQINQVFEAAKQGDQQAQQIAQMIQLVVQELKGQATVAKWGSKLGYIKSLKYAKGGKTCKKHEKGNNLKKKLSFVKQEK